MKNNIAVIFGGVNCEHDISIISSVQAMSHIDSNYYNIIPVYITRENKWLTGEFLKDINSYANLEKYINKAKNVTFLPNSKYLYVKSFFGIKKLVKIDVSLVIMHGKNGEDGTLSGLFELNQIPYTCSDVVGSSVCCDKVVFKEFIKGLNLNTIDSVSLSKQEYLNNVEKCIAEIEERLGYPFIIKPSNLGSSIGITVCRNKSEVSDALSLAFELDERVLIEKYYSNIKEINVAIMGMANDYVVSEIEEPIRSENILSFNNKYLNDSSSGMASAKRIIPANISKEIYNQAVDDTVLIFKELNLKGVIRIDYIIDNDTNTLFVNEANTIPGSLAFYLFKPKNIDYNQLINKLIKCAMLTTGNKLNKSNKYFSSVLTGGSFNMKNGIKN